LEKRALGGAKGKKRLNAVEIKVREEGGGGG